MQPTTETGIHKLNPATGALIASYPIATEGQVIEVVQKSRAALPGWQGSTLGQRVAVLRSIRKKLYDRALSMAAIISQETGKSIVDAQEADIATALNALSYYIEVGPKQLQPSLIAPDLISLITGRLHRKTWQPRGVIAIISPWNFPLGIAGSGLATALMAGNCIILKPSELTPATGEVLVQVVREALSEQGFSPDVAQVLIGDGATGAHLVEQDINGIIFTGSERTGKRVAQKAAERDLWYSLELGGSDAMIVLEGCDLDQAASYALWGRFANAGQTCAAVKRLLIPAKRQEEFLSLLTDKIKKLKLGGPENPENHVGPLINAAQRDLIDAQVQDAIQKGARLVTGGQKISGPGFFYEPTLLADVPPDARVLREETFGPVLPVMAYSTLDEAIRLANDSPFGLTASVFGPVATAKAVASQLHCGTVVINEVGPSNFAMTCAPWGGWKKSGSGRSHGAEALRDLNRLQVISENLFYGLPGLNKPLWHFGSNPTLLAERAKTVLAFAGRQAALWHPQRWLPFWHNRAGTKF